jgi:predicted AlkP superfamily pyrophosphatase or phosphodiesterase
MRQPAGLLLIVVAMLAAGCSRQMIIAPALQPRTPEVLPRLTEHVILVSIDGLRPDAIAAFKAPTLQRLVAEGCYSLTASTILPSKTLPSHTSMLTGVPPEVHGVLWNDAFSDAPGTLATATVFSVAYARGYSTAAFFSKAKFSHLQRPGTLSYSQAPGGWFGRWTASQTLGDVERYLATERPHLLFVHLPDPDVAGHAHGWMSPQYGMGVMRADTAVKRLMTAADTRFGANNYTLIVTADHGGHGKDHGSDHPSDVTIPWIAWGKAVERGELPTGVVKTVDTAATVLYLLGVNGPPDWLGSPVRTAFASSSSQ